MRCIKRTLHADGTQTWTFQKRTEEGKRVYKVRVGKGLGGGSSSSGSDSKAETETETSEALVFNRGAGSKWALNDGPLAEFFWDEIAPKLGMSAEEVAAGRKEDERNRMHEDKHKYYRDHGTPDVAIMTVSATKLLKEWFPETFDADKIMPKQLKSSCAHILKQIQTSAKMVHVRARARYDKGQKEHKKWLESSGKEGKEFTHRAQFDAIGPSLFRWSRNNNATGEREYCDEYNDPLLTPEQLVHRWKTSTEARDRGTALHAKIEQFINRPGELRGTMDRLAQSEVEVAQFLQFYDDFTKEGNVFVRTEWIILDPERKMGGSIDFLYLNPEGKLCIGDWKCSKRIPEYHNKYTKKAPFPVGSLTQTDLGKYTMQQSIYGLLLQERFGLEVHSAMLAVFHSTKETYHIERLPLLIKEAKVMLDMYDEKVKSGAVKLDPLDPADLLE